MIRNAVIYVHGKGGSAAEAAHYAPLFPESEVIGLDYDMGMPWESAPELRAAFDEAAGRFDRVTLIANSIGAYFSMLALGDRAIERAFFISPIVDMERLILDMMGWAKVSETELRERQKIATSFGETLSYPYLTYVREHPIHWAIPTQILYAGRDSLTSRGTVEAFAQAHHAGLTVMEDGEHWFHTPQQLAFLDAWLTDCIDDDHGKNE